MVWTNQWDVKKGIRFPWKFWSKEARIIGCQNKESEAFLLELTKTIKWPGKTFRAWRQGDYGFSTLVTVVLPPDALEIFKQDEVIPLILQQNGLSSAHSVPRFKTKPKGRAWHQKSSRSSELSVGKEAADPVLLKLT